MISGLKRHEITDPANHKQFQPPEVFAPGTAETMASHHLQYDIDSKATCYVTARKTHRWAVASVV
jgi:hypothetical protein